MHNTFEHYVRELYDREKRLNAELDVLLTGELRTLRLKQEGLEVDLASITRYGVHVTWGKWHSSIALRIVANSS